MIFFSPCLGEAVEKFTCSTAAGWLAKVLSDKHEREGKHHLPSKVKRKSSASFHESSSQGEILKVVKIYIFLDKKLVPRL